MHSKVLELRERAEAESSSFLVGKQIFVGNGEIDYHRIHWKEGEKLKELPFHFSQHFKHYL